MMCNGQDARHTKSTAYVENPFGWVKMVKIHDGGGVERNSTPKSLCY